MPGTCNEQVDIAIIGAGIAGIATAYYLSVRHGKKSVLLIDPRQPMSYTSAQSGDNYRNWWPHPVMTAFTNDSIDELDRLAEESNNVFNMTRGGYVLASRQDADSEGKIRGDAITTDYPWLSDEIRSVTHIPRGGDISGQQLGMYMLQRIRERGGKLLRGAHQIEREYRVIRALGDTDVPVPRAHALCEDPDVIGTPFYVMDDVAGRIFRRPDLPALAPEARILTLNGAESLETEQ